METASGAPRTSRTVGFGPFVLDLRTGELTRSGHRVRLQGQGFQVLSMLVEQPGELVTREALRQRLWSEDTYVDFEQGLNNAVKRLRESLGDSAEKPKYIETLPRLGYRFVGEVKAAGPVVAASAAVEEMRGFVDSGPGGPALGMTQEAAATPGMTRSEAAANKSGLRRWGLVAASVVVALATVVFFVVRERVAHASDRNIRSIAVLPFANMSGDASQDYFADAMTEEMTSDLAKIGALRVISRTSSMHFKGTKQTAPEIARELDVDGVIEGSVVRTGDRVRITAQLINARRDVHLWSDSYERDVKDVLSLQNELAHTIAAEVRAAISPAEEGRLRPQEVKPEAYEAYLLGRAQLEKWTTSGLTEAVRYFDHAIELDNRFALAYIGLAESYTSHPGVAGVSSSEARKRAMAAVVKAIELKPEMGEAHVMLGGLREFEWDFAGAEVEMRKGLALSPGYGAGHHWYSHLLIYQGRYGEAMVEAKKMLELDPLSPAANLHMGFTYEAMRDWDHAIEQQHKTLRLDPNYVDAHETLGRVYMGKGMVAEGVAELRRAAELVHTGSDPDYAWHAGELGYALARSGNTAEAKKILAGMPQSEPAAASCVYAGLGDTDKSITLLTEAYRQHAFPFDAEFLVQYDSLRSDPRFVKLLRDVGLR